MSFEPQKFFIGVIDLFSVLLPGAVLAYVVKEEKAILFGKAGMPLDSAERWIVFGFVSYLIGHIAFLFGAKLDEWLYDPLRSGTERGHIRLLASGKPRRNRLIRALARATFRKNPDNAVVQVERLTRRTLAPVGDGAENAMNAFQWSKAMLSKEHRDGLATVENLEAHSKFFRTFGVVLIALVVLSPWLPHFDPAATVVSLLLLVPVMWRYVDQRFKATQQAYWSVLTDEALKATHPAPPLADGAVTHAGAVVVRHEKGVPKYLLVTASRNPNEWVLPKGHIESREDPRECAVREVWEETGFWGRIVGYIDDVQFGKEATSRVVRFYRMELDGSDEIEGAQRKVVWATLEEALEKASFEETRELLRRTSQLLQQQQVEAPNRAIPARA